MWRAILHDFCSDCLEMPHWFCLENWQLCLESIWHGHVNTILLLATLIPLITDKLGDHCSSNNYRWIAISSLILKIFGWVIIILYMYKLTFDDLQFSYLVNGSTNMCTWMVVETINYFSRIYIGNGLEESFWQRKAKLFMASDGAGDVLD